MSRMIPIAAVLAVLSMAVVTLALPTGVASAGGVSCCCLDGGCPLCGECTSCADCPCCDFGHAACCTSGVCDVGGGCCDSGQAACCLK